MKKIFLITVSCFCFFASYAQTVTVNEKIEELNRQMEKSFRENDMLVVASFYLDSALISGGRMSISGRKGIDQYWMSLKDQNAEWKLETESIEDFGAYVLEKGKSFLKFKTAAGTEQESNVRFFIMWKKTADSYKILYDVFKRL
jgi:ketosteroid isomerase-like protein